MALENRIDALKRKHADIDNELQKESIRTSTDSLKLARLKAVKLSLKDEIERLQKPAPLDANLRASSQKETKARPSSRRRDTR